MSKNVVSRIKNTKNLWYNFFHLLDNENLKFFHPSKMINFKYLPFKIYKFILFLYI